MSKPISFGFGKPKISIPTAATSSTPKPISFPTVKRPTSLAASRSSKSALRHDSDDEDEVAPQPEAVTGFTSSGAVLSKAPEERKERVIANSGNGDWRKRGQKNLLPAEVQAAQQQVQRNGGELVTVERNEVSTASGLQFAEASETTELVSTSEPGLPLSISQPQKALTEDERALQALLEDGTGKPKSTAIIETQGNVLFNQRDETEDFRADVASRPDPCTLEDYAAMPVEEFGMAMLRGMGQKRRANGELINFDRKDDDKNAVKKQRKQEGFLGIGAKPAPGLEGVELGAWGKAEMRKNQKGQGFFTPVMMEDKRTGERITEEEFERRKKEAKVPKKDESDWRDRRDKNLEKDGRESTNGDTNGSKKRDRDDRGYESRSRRDPDRDDRNYDSSRSRKESDRDGRDYDSSRSRRDRDRSRSRDRRKRDDGDDRVNGRDKYRDRDRDRHRDDDRYESSSSRRNGHRDRERDRDRDGKRRS